MVAAGIAEANTIVPNQKDATFDKKEVQANVEVWRQYWDLENGGDTGGEQKFMIPSNLIFLLDYAILQDDDQAKAHVKNTLDKMAKGGIYDHLAGGFYRYSTDSQWKVPHFEKMLYDNAQLLSLYSKAYTVFGDTEYRRVVWETIDFLKREMKNEEGGYYAALDADTEGGEEGKFYVWGKQELQEILKNDFELFSKYYSINEADQWEVDTYVLHVKSQDADFAKSEGITEGGELQSRKEKWHKSLLEERSRRTAPGIDDKVITSWNALLITGLVDAIRHLSKIIF